MLSMRKSSEKYPGRSHLFRGEFPRIPEDFKTDPPMKLLAEHVKSIKVQVWNGEDWHRDNWDSTRRETNNRVPQMVRVIIQAWREDSFEGEPSETSQEELAQFATLVYLPYALDFNELKTRSKSFNLKAVL